MHSATGLPYMYQQMAWPGWPSVAPGRSQWFDSGLHSGHNLTSGSYQPQPGVWAPYDYAAYYNSLYQYQAQFATQFPVAAPMTSPPSVEVATTMKTEGPEMSPPIMTPLTNTEGHPYLTSSTTSSMTSETPSSPVKVFVSSNRSRPRKRPLESGKPPYSYIALICMAIANHPEKKALLREIIDYIANRFPYYTRHTRWHSTIRHNLTLNDCFVKCPRRHGDKGHRWAIDPEFQDMFDQGSLMRRRYRYKEGSAKWMKSRLRTARDRTSSDALKGALPLDDLTSSFPLPMSQDRQRTPSGNSITSRTDSSEGCPHPMTSPIDVTTATPTSYSPMSSRPYLPGHATLSSCALGATSPLEPTTRTAVGDMTSPDTSPTCGSGCPRPLSMFSSITTSLELPAFPLPELHLPPITASSSHSQSQEPMGLSIYV